MVDDTTALACDSTRKKRHGSHQRHQFSRGSVVNPCKRYLGTVTARQIHVEKKILSSGIQSHISLLIIP
jgi:hypothetical protein